MFFNNNEWKSNTVVAITDKGKKNPKKEKSMSHDRYNAMLKYMEKRKDPVTVDELLRKSEYRMDDVRNDYQKGYISLTRVEVKAD